MTTGRTEHVALILVVQYGQMRSHVREVIAPEHPGQRPYAHGGLVAEEGIGEADG